MRDDRPIGLFDSGLGGLTVVRALLDLVPGADVVYFGDTGRFPYGSKPPEEVLKYSLEIVDLLLEQNVRMVVVACNSAASVALEQLREQLDVPVVGVIGPGLRSARRATRTGRVGVIATVSTIASGAYQRAGAQLAADASDPAGAALELTCAACPGFVEFVEQGDVDSDQVHVLAERLLAPLKQAYVDTLVLGCTHYPLLARTIADVMGPDVVLVSSAEETAFEVRAELGEPDLDVPTDRPRQVKFMTSGDPTTFRELGSRFLGPEVEHVEAWSWS
ncbi:MAG: glutamate racemase [Actinomycetota bacterium]|jgi:glutamate racemase|nr:glutamate racemase [Actinomycetota bacterium]